MTVLRSNTRQDKVLFNKPGKGYKFNICVTNLMAIATKENVKLDPAYINTYDSQKYTNCSQLRDVTFNPSCYLTFNYHDYEQKDNNCSVFVSFPYLEDLQDFIQSMYDMINGNDYFNKKNGVVPSKKEAYISSEQLGGGKQLVVSPISLRTDNGNDRGCIFSLYDPDEDLSYGNVTLSEREVYNIYMTLLNIDNIALLNMSDSLCIMSMLALGAGSSAGEDEESSSGTRPPRRGKGSRRTPAGRNGRRPSVRGSMKDTDEEESDDEIEEEKTEYVEDADDAIFDTGEDDDMDEEEDEKPVVKKKTKKSSKSSSKKSTSSSSKKKKKPKKLSMDEILEEADEMEYDEDDDDIDFDED